MTVSGVVCEYNPFHNGHKYMLESMRRDGTSHIVCIMSGNFVQRGECAVCDKYTRAEMAVKSGADLVIELPLPYAVGTAETFARGAVGILDKLGCVDRLYFGSESPLNELEQCLAASQTEAFRDKIREYLAEGLSYPTAFSMASGSETADSPNNILALEYMKQLKTLESDMEPRSVLRVGAGHDSKEESDGYFSASAIRRLIHCKEDIDKYLPEAAAEMIKRGIENKELPSDEEKIEVAVLSALRSMTEQELERIADVNEGLEYRLKKAINQATDIEEMMSLIKTRRYTTAKIRRIILCAYLGVTKEMQTRLPDYVSVLACNEKGLEIIRQIKEKSGVTVITKHSEASVLSDEDTKLYNFTDKCDDLYGLTLPNIRKCGYNREKKFQIIK